MTVSLGPSQRWLHVWAPRLSIDRVRRECPSLSTPLALIAKRDNALRIEALDDNAETLGLEVGLSLAAARARVPQLVVVQADLAADQDLLARIGEACRRYTPSFALDPPAGVHLNITGVAKLFGGERKLIADLSACLHRQGIAVRIGVARTLGLAWALSRQENRKALKSVRDLPVSALRIDTESLGVLHRLGLRNVGQIIDIPRLALGRRLGDSLLQRLDEALGFRAAAPTSVPEPLDFHVQHKLAEPIHLDTQILNLCYWLAGRLAERLERRCVGGRIFALNLFRVDGACKRLTVQTGRPLRDPARITALFTERLEVLNDGLEADFGFDLIRLTAETVERIAPETSDFMLSNGDRDMTALIDRLTVRLGPEAVRRFAPAATSHFPEQAVRSIPFSTENKNPWRNETPALYGDVLLRPLTLFSPPQHIEAIAGVPEDPPQQFQWRRFAHRIVRAEGPERIAWEWWRTPESTSKKEAEDALPSLPNPGAPGEPEPTQDRNLRDYYRLEDEQGRRFWVFREGAYVAGIRPRWFLHGLFP